MKHLLPILLAALLCATASAQTIRTLGYNSTNGQIVAATNVVWTNSFSFSTNTVAAVVRTNIGLPLSALTNTNTQNFREAIQAAAATSTSVGVGPGVADKAIELVGNDNGTTVLFYDELGGDLWQITDPSDFQGALFSATNSAPANTTNVAGWVDLKVGTNSYKLPVYQ